MLPLILADPRGMCSPGRSHEGRPDGARRRPGGALLHEPRARAGRPADRPCERSSGTSGSRSRRFASKGPTGSPWSASTARSSRRWETPCRSIESLILLRVNAAYIDELLQSHRSETVAGHLRHVAAAGLIEAVGGSPEALRLVVEFGADGEAR